MPSMKITKNKTFILLFSLLYFISFLLLFSRRGVGLYFHPFYFDSFMDLFYMAACPVNSTYPPLSLIPYKIIYLLTHPDIVQSAVVIRGSYYGAFFLMLYIFAFTSVFLYTMFFFVRGDSKRKIFYSLLFLFSGIVLWATERSNLMSFAFLLSLLFVVLYCGGDEKKKRISYILLALAISLKLYPGAFLLLLLEKKDAKGIASIALETLVIFAFSYVVCKYFDLIIKFEQDMGLFEYVKGAKSYIKVLFHLAAVFLIAAAGCFVVYEIYRQNWKFMKFFAAASFFVLVLLVPFFYFFKGVNLFAKMAGIFSSVFDALRFGDGMSKSAEGVNVSMKNFVLLAHFLLTGKASLQNSAFLILCKIFCVLLSVFSFAFNKKQWKKIASVSLLCVYIPDFSGFYLLVYLLIPLLFFINDSSSARSDYVYACLFAITTTFLVVPYKFKVESYYLLTGSFVVISLCVFCLFLLLAANAVYDLAKQKREKK